MGAFLTVVVVLLVIAAVAALGYAGRRQLRTGMLRRRFGPEYERTVRRHGSRPAAERELAARVQRHRGLDLRPLGRDRREHYRGRWTEVQGRFVDAPEAAVEEADALVTAAMGERGYPTNDFEDRASHLSVEHGRTLDHYRRGHEISARAGRREATTEDLRQAMVHYRALFEDLLAVPDADPRTEDEEAAAAAEEAEAEEEHVRRSDEKDPRS